MLLAEREGFEPSVQTSCTTDFESAAFDHSATFPSCIALCLIRPTLNLLSVCILQTQICPSGFCPPFISAHRFDNESAAYHSLCHLSIVYSIMPDPTDPQSVVRLHPANTDLSFGLSPSVHLRSPLR